MLMDILPEDVATEVRDRRNHLNSTGKVMGYIHEQLSRCRDKELSALQDKRAEHALEHSPKNPIYSLGGAERKVEGMVSNMETLNAAFSQGTR